MNTNVNLLSYLDALAIELGVNAGNYDEVLSTPVSVGQLFDVALDVLPTGTAPDVSAGLNSLAQLGLSLPQITLGQLLDVDPGMASSALDVGLNLLQLVQGGVQLANGNSVVAANLPTVGIPGIATVSVKLKVIEPAQPSAIGYPALAAADPAGPHAIQVRTAQVRTLVTVDLGGVTGLINGITSALSGVLSPIIDFIETTSVNPVGGLLNGVASILSGLLDLVNGLLTSLLGTEYHSSWQTGNIIYAEALSQPISISLDAATATGRVTNYNCAAGAKSLEAKATTALAYLRVGKMQESNVFSATTPTVEPAPVVEIGYRKYRARRNGTRPNIFSLWTWSNEEQWLQSNETTWATGESGKNTAKRYTIAGLGLKVDGPIGGSSSPTLTYGDPPKIGEEPAYQDVPSSAVLSGVGSTLNNSLYPYQSTAPGILGGLLTGTLTLATSVLNAVANGLLETTVKGVLDPILNSLLGTLGADVAVTELGANLSCEGGGATLVD